MAGLAITTVPFCMILWFSVLQARWNPFTLLLGLGILACGKGIRFYNSPEIRKLYQ